MGSIFDEIGPTVAELWASASAVWGGGSLMKSFVRCRIFGEGVSSVHALPPKNVTLVCRFVPVVTVTFFASHEDWGRYHAPSKILPNTSLVQKLLRIPLLLQEKVRQFTFTGVP